MMRRRVLKAVKWLAVLTVAGVVVVAGWVAWAYTSTLETRLDGAGFDQPLAVPPLLEGDRDADGRLVFDLRLQEGETELLPGVTTPTWGANGSYLGPTLRARRGDEVLVRVASDVPETTTVHWHGMHLPAVMDGGPHQPIHPGETWEPTWTVDQPAATLWYHPHLHEQTAEHVYNGIAGMFILDDGAAEDLLPSTYGVDDVPLIVQDKRFDGDGALSMAEGPGNLVGVLGDEILVNGTHEPRLEATTSLLRLRLLNASNARVYDFGFDDDRSFAVVGTDSGLLEAPVETTRLQLSPGERGEIVVALEPSDRAILRSYPPDIGMSGLMGRTNGADDTFDILLVEAADDLERSEPLPATLATIDPPAPQDAATTRSFTLSGFTRINDQKMDMSRIDEVVPPGAVEVWEVHNDSNTMHNFHVHDIHFWILDRNGAAPAALERGWKDTAFLPPGDTVRFIARFGEYRDDEYPYMFHCHILRHEDAGMMGQFVVADDP